MKRIVICILVLLLTAAPSWAAYKIYLKNGAIIRGVNAYTRSDGQLMYRTSGGSFGLPEEDVLKIEDTGAGEVEYITEPTSKTSEETKPPDFVIPEIGKLKPESAATRSANKRITGIDARIAQIEVKEAEVGRIQKQYDHVRLRLETLFQKGRKQAIAEGGNPAQWFRFLPPQEAQWAKLNSIKKNSMALELNAMREELGPLLDEKAQLEQEKQLLQGTR